jgi:AcrR family transcriptional regulator
VVVEVVERTGRGGRPRSAEADEAIRRATLELLERDGYANLTTVRIATTAGVSTATLYRRWRSKLDLVVDVLRALADEQPVPDTGSLAGDCRALAHAVVSRMPSTGPMMAGLVGEFARNPELAESMRRNLILPRRATMFELLDRAAQRGELRPDVNYDLVFDVLAGAAYYAFAVMGRPPTPEMADELADLVLRAIEEDRR